MFRGSTRFNQDIGRWNVANVENMDSMFEGATRFNQDIGRWNVTNVQNMDSLFAGATQFKQKSLQLGSISCSERDLRRHILGHLLFA
mmetsp:Transcript_27373/g.63548  ORF Transcript_27373/g.63548 Transcript_27373/m.63548 type:complete len:87 (-) Transcript_27373:1862-2122(-)